MKNTIIASFACGLLFACSSSNNRLTDGIWRAEFLVPDDTIPFLFEVSGADSDNAVLTLINGRERVNLTGISYRNDTVIIPIDAYDAVLEAVVSGGGMTGTLIKRYSTAPSGRVPFTAQKGVAPRFPDNGEKALISIDGRWEITVPERDSAKQVGVFEQSGDGHLTGSILTPTGDYRYLEGSVRGNTFLLSAFAGMTPYLVRGEFSDDDNFTAEFVTPSSVTRFTGTRNPEASLPDAYAMTTLKSGFTSVDFRLPDLDGRPISLSDPKFNNKAVIVTVLGSWCPNCLDETSFLAPWYKANRERGVEIIGLAFERKDDFEYARKQLSQLKAHYGIEYDILFAGKVGEETTSKVLPELSKVMSYPTMIFIDRKGRVRKIHTGFSGPATGVFYENFKTEFNRTMDELIAEK